MLDRSGIAYRFRSVINPRAALIAERWKILDRTPKGELVSTERERKPRTIIFAYMLVQPRLYSERWFVIATVFRSFAIDRLIAIHLSTVAATWIEEKLSACFTDTLKITRGSYKLCCSALYKFNVLTCSRFPKLGVNAL